MNLSTSLVSLSAAAMIWAGPVQGGLKPVDPQSSPLTPVQQFDAGTWATALGETDLVQRKASYEELLDLARREPAALNAIKAWAEDTSQVELAWTAQLMLRELERKPTRRLSPFGHGQTQPFGFRDLDSLFEDLHGRNGGGLFGLGGMDPFGGLNLDELLQGGTGSHSGMKIFQDGDGIRVEITEEENGQSHTKTYEARDMEELLETYPELQGRLGGGAGLHGLRIGRDSLVPNAPKPTTPWNPGGGGLRLIEPSLDRLGIQMLTPERRTLTYPGADAEVGLQVEFVLPGSLADSVGIEPGDLVISIDGREIHNAEDVRQALAATNTDRKIDIEVIQQDGSKQTRSWLPRRQPL